MPPTEISPQAAAIAAQIGETETGPLSQIQRALDRCGPELVQAVLAEPLSIEARGGQMLPDGSRRRTPGGVFFQLLHQRVSPDDWRRIRGATTAVAPPPARPLVWSERAESAQAALARPGLATSARLTVVGRPREAKAREGLMIVTVDGGETLPALPRGLPAAEQVATTYKVCVAEGLWRRVEPALSNPGAVLIADGYAVPNHKAASVTLLARFITAKPGAAGLRPGVMKVQISGRPGEVIDYGPTVLTALTSRQAPRLPEGVPPPPPVTYLVYSVAKQWRRLEAAWQQAAGAALIFDGYCFYDAGLKGLAVLAQHLAVRAERPPRGERAP